MYLDIKKVTINIITLALVSSMHVNAMDPNPQQEQSLESLLLLKPCTPGEEDVFQHLIMKRKGVVKILENLDAMKIPQEPTFHEVFEKECGCVIVTTLANFIQEHKITTSFLSQEMVYEITSLHQDILNNHNSEFSGSTDPLHSDQLIALREDVKNILVESLHVSFNYLQAFYPDLEQVFGTFENFWNNR